MTYGSGTGFADKLPRNLSFMAARSIGERIIGGEWLPGATLPDEPSLCRMLDVSRTVVREAVKTLTAKGLVEVRPRRGTTVLPRHRWQVLDPDLLSWQQAVTPSKHILDQLLEVRRIFEPEVAALAAERADLQSCQRIRQAIEQMRIAVDTTEPYVAADAGFHAALLHAARNEYLDALEPVIFTGLRASIRVTNPLPESNKSSLQLHETVAEAVENRDPDAARVAMQTLLADAHRRILAANGRG